MISACETCACILFFKINVCSCLLQMFYYIHRRRIDFGMLEDPSSELTDEELEFYIEQIKSSTPHIGISLTIGRIRSMGYHVTRERVWQVLRQIDPLSNAIRWPGGLTNRRPYCVAGPNSLWHIGKLVV